MRISAIVAMSENFVIGKGLRLPWHLPEDLKKFREITWGHPIVMGRKTFESIGKVLPGRENFILSRQRDLVIPGVQVFDSLSKVKDACEGKTDEIFVIGGAEIYQVALSQVNRLYLTLIHQTIEGDTYFPALNWDDYVEVSREERGGALPFSFLVLDRKKDRI